MITHDYYELFQDDSIDKQLIIETSGGFTIGNEDIFSESMETTESLCSEAQLTFGSCEASSFKIKIANIMSPLIGQWLTVSYKLNGNDTKFPVGKYKVFSDTPTADRKWREIVAYDSMYDILNTDVADWYNSVLPNADSTTTLRKFRDSFFSYFGITQETATLVNDSMTVEQTISPSELSGKDVITAICEINGVLGHITRNGTFKYIKLEQYIEGLYPANDLYPSDDLFPRDARTAKVGANGTYISCTYEDYVCKGIDKLQIRKEENDIGAIVGTGDNCYIIEDNFLVYGKNADDLDTIANNVLDVVKDLQYRPFTAEIKGNLCLEVGDAVRLVTKYEIIESYILQRTLKGIQALRDTFTTEGEEERSEKVNSVNKQIIELKGKTNTIESTVEVNRVRMENIDTEQTKNLNDAKKDLSDEITTTKNNLSSEITTTANNILTEVTNKTNTLQINIDDVAKDLSDAEEQIQKDITFTKKELTSSIEQTADSITQQVLNSQDTWDLSAYNVKYQGFGTPERLYSSDTPQVGDYYFDVNDGNLYQLATVASTEDTNYYKVTYSLVNLDEDSKIKKTSEVLSSSITQTASSITAEVLSTTDTWYKYDDDGNAYTVKYQGIGTSTKLYSEDTPAVGDYYLDTSTGILYKLNSVKASGEDYYYTVSYTKVKQLEKTSKNLQTQITANAGEIDLKVSKDSVIASINASAETDEGGSAVTINADKIKLNGDTVIDAINGSSSKVTIQANNINLSGYDTATTVDNKLSSKVSSGSVINDINNTTQTDSNGSKITISADKISLNGDTVISAINGAEGKVTIKADKINLEGYVTAKSLSASGSTTINGDNITSGTINGAKFKTISSSNEYELEISSGLIKGSRSNGAWYQIGRWNNIDSGSYYAFRIASSNSIELKPGDSSYLWIWQGGNLYQGATGSSNGLFFRNGICTYVS